MLKLISFTLAVILVMWGIPQLMPEKPETEFAVSPSGEFSSAERSYYEQIFNYTMEAIQPNRSYAWQSYSVSGSIVASESFVSKSGSTCRKYTEIFNVAGKVVNSTGIGCKRSGGTGWCRLKESSAALTCALEPKTGIAVPSIDPRMPGTPTINVETPDMPDIDINIGGGGSRGGSYSGGIGNVGGNFGGGGSSGSSGGDSRESNDNSGKGVANKVTGTAGNAASKTTRTLKDWFIDTFE